MNGFPVWYGFASINQITMLYPNETDTANSIVDNFKNNNRWVILTAQMQSGKTHTFLISAFLMLMYTCVSNVIIFSGSAETDLKEQLVESLDEFCPKFARYLADTKGEKTYMEYYNLCIQLRTHIRIVWSCETTQYTGDSTDTLVIWEESHFAQNKGMRPWKFLSKLGISPNGDPVPLLANNQYVLSVSATHFSETCDNIRLNQHKQEVIMIPGNGYCGVDNHFQHNRIVGFVNKHQCFREALTTHAGNGIQFSYGVVRCNTEKTSNQFRDIATQCNWKTVIYNSVVKEIRLQDMDTMPTQNTVIIIKGMCRMGKRLIHKHKSFDMETATNSKSDAVLQGLLGRGCGYETNPNGKIYLHQKIIDRGDLQRYVSDMMVWSARNIVSNGQKKQPLLHSIIPIKIKQSDLTIHGSREVDPCSSNTTVESLRIAIQAAFADKRIHDLNKREQSVEVYDKIMSPSTIVNVKHVKSSHKTYIHMPEKMAFTLSSSSSSVLSGDVKRFGKGCGLNPKGNEITLWVFHHKYENPNYTHIINKGDVFIDALTLTKNQDQVIRPLPHTTGREVFCQRILETEEVIESNGSYTIDLPIQTNENADLMCASLGEFIEMSLQMNVVNARPRFITSNQTRNSKYQGIVVTNDIYNSLINTHARTSINRIIYEKYHVTLCVTKNKGPQIRALSNAGFVRIIKISW